MTRTRAASVGRLLCLTGAATGALGLSAWVAGMPFLTALVAGQPWMVPNTALGLLLTGVAGALRNREGVRGLRRMLSILAALVVLALGVGTLAEYALQTDAHIDRFLLQIFRREDTQGPYPGRSSPPTALALALLSAALLLFDFRPRARARPSEWLALSAFFAAFTALVGFAYGAGALYRLGGAPVTGVAMPTAVGLLLISAGLLLERPHAGIVRVVTSPGARQLRQTQERFELALRGADLAAWDWNVRTGEVIFNPRWAEMRGFQPDQIKPHVDSWVTTVHPEDWPRIQKALSDHFQGLIPEYETEHRVRTRSGEWLWVLDRGKVFARDEQGQPLRMVGTELDITQRKRLEEDLRLSLAQFSGILSISADAIISIDESQRITMFNEGAEKIFGCSKAEAIGTALERWIPERFRAIHRQHVNRFATSGEVSRRGSRECATLPDGPARHRGARPAARHRGPRSAQSARRHPDAGRASEALRGATGATVAGAAGGNRTRRHPDVPPDQ